MDIALIAQEKISKFVSDGTIDQMIETQIKKTLESTITDVLRDYSEFGRELKKAIGEKLKVNLNEISIPVYSNTICKIIEDTMVATSLEPSIKMIQASVKDCINQMEKKNWKLSEIIKKYLEDTHKSVDATYEVGETEYSSYWVNVGSKKDKKYSGYSGRDDYDLRMLVDAKTNIVSNVWYEGKAVNGLSVDKKWGFDGFLMGLWINECAIEVDNDDDLDEACIREHECHC